MNDPTSTLPTEEGLYLFCGSREGHIYRVNDLIHGERVEVVRIHHLKDGRINYIGLDFFHDPNKAVGVWVKITEEGARLKHAADAMLLDHAARTLVPQVCKSRWWNQTRAAVVAELVGPMGNDGEFSVAEKVFDRAVELGVLVPGKHAGYWQLVETPTR